MYDKFLTIAQAAKAYRRCRTRKSFILTGVRDLARVKCAHCDRKLSEYAPDNVPGEETDTHEIRSQGLADAYHGNRVEYIPRLKAIVAVHYTCGWRHLLGACATGDYAEAVANFIRTAPKPVRIRS